MAHLDLAAEARKKEPKPTQKGVESESELSAEDEEKKPEIFIADIGHVGWDAEDDTIVEPDTSKTMPVPPLKDHVAALRTAFQKDLIEAIPKNRKLSDILKHWKDLDRIFGAAVTSLDFKMDLASGDSRPGAFGAGLSFDR